MTIANRTTTVDAAKTVSEIQLMLAAAGASGTGILYGRDATPNHISFQIECDGQKLSFRLSSNWEGVLNALKRERGGIPKHLLTEAHAKRVSWRIKKDWLRIQLTLIESGESTLHEIMLPWAITHNGQTVAQSIFSGTTKRLRLN